MTKWEYERPRSAQIVAANPFVGGISSLSDEERTAMIPVAASLVSVLREMKKVDPSIKVREELNATEIPKQFLMFL